MTTEQRVCAHQVVLDAANADTAEQAAVRQWFFRHSRARIAREDRATLHAQKFLRGEA